MISIPEGALDARNRMNSRSGRLQKPRGTRLQARWPRHSSLMRYRTSSVSAPPVPSIEEKSMIDHFGNGIGAARRWIRASQTQVNGDCRLIPRTGAAGRSGRGAGVALGRRQEFADGGLGPAAGLQDRPGDPDRRRRAAGGRRRFRFPRTVAVGAEAVSFGRSGGSGASLGERGPFGPCGAGSPLRLVALGSGAAACGLGSSTGRA